MELYSVASQKATTANAASTVVKPGEEAPIGWADPYTLRQFGVKIVIGGEESSQGLQLAWTHWDGKTLRDDIIRISLYILYFHCIRVQIGYHSYDWSFKSFNNLQVFPATRGALHPRSGTADGNPDQKSEGDPVGFLAKAVSFNLHSFPLYPCSS